MSDRHPQSLVFISVRTKLKAVFQKQFADFYGVYRESKDADSLYERLDEIFDYLDEEIFKFSQAEEVSLESCIEAMASIFIMAFLLTLDDERGQIPKSDKKNKKKG